ncbi:MAG TPA: Ig-like domain repeat protein [Candidatus Koribacter sp.]|jgi:hypothetical protein
MLRIALRNIQNAGTFVCAVLLASTPALSQAPIRSIQQRSIVSLAPSPRPQGASLARHAGEATFEHAPENYHVFAATSVGEHASFETLTLTFAGETTLSNIKLANKDFVIEPGGSCYAGNHYSAGQNCSLLVRFTPQGPGHRLGFLKISHSSESSPASIGLVGNGYAPVVSFTPSQISTVTGTVSSGTGTLKSASNMAVDGGDTLYIADVGNSLIKEIDSSAAINTISPAFATPQSLAVDTLGIIYSANVSASTYYFSYFAPWATQTAYGTTYAPGSCTPSATCPLTTVGMSKPANMSIDNYDNLFFEEGTKGAAEMPVTNVSGGTGSFNLWYLTNQFIYSNGTPASFAVDANGNLYNTYIYSTANTCYLLQEPLYNAEYSPTANRVAGGTKCGFSGDGGQGRTAEISSTIGQITFDIAGNLYFADAGNQRVRRIDAATGIITTIAGNGTAGYSGDTNAATSATLSNPTGVAVDSQGQVYILSNAPTAGPTQVIRKVGVKGYHKFSSQLKGTSSAPTVFTVANTGNQTLTLSADAVLSGSNPSDFAIDPGTTTCTLTAGTTIAAGRSCKIGIVFQPSGTATYSANLQLQDNTVTGTNTISVTGTGILNTPTIAITSPAKNATITHGTTITYSVSVTSTGSTKPTGTVTFKASGNPIGSPVTLSGGGTASTTFSETTLKTYLLSVTYNGDANFSPATASEDITIDAANPVHLSLLPAVSSSSACGTQTFTVQASSPSGGTPTGTIALMSGTTKLSSATLNNGSAVLSAGPRNNGQQSFFAKYSGDDSHPSAVSAPVTGTVRPMADCIGNFRFFSRSSIPTN